MKRIILISVVILAAVSCNSEDGLLLEELQAELATLEKEQLPVVPGAEAVPDVPGGDYSFTFGKSCYGVDAGGSVAVDYSLPETSSVEVMVKEGWSATVESKGATGTVTVTAPDPASPTEIVVNAVSASGRRTATRLPVMVRDPYSDATRPRLEAMGYYCFKPWNATPENFRKLADAGLTMVTMETDEGDWRDYINYAAQAGIKTLAVVGNQGRYWYDHMEDTALDEVIGDLMEYPNVFGYHIYDEPSVNDIWKLLAIKDKIRKIDASRPIYINLLPNASSASLGVGTYQEYVNTMADYMDFDFISFDMYPILVGSIQSDWHMCLETVADAAKRRGIPFWAFAASCWINKEPGIILKRDKPNAYNILLQVYTNLAYGAQAVQYFTIQDYGGTDYAPIMRDGTWTQAYEDLKTANLTMQKRAFVFKDCNVTRIRQLGQSASHESALSWLDFPPEVKSMKVTFSATVSFIENCGNEYIVVVNNYWSADQSLELELDAPVFAIGSDGQFRELEPGMTQLELAKGEMVVLKYK